MMNEVIQTLYASTKGKIHVFRFTLNTRAEMLRVLGRYASDPNVPFTWYDAAQAATHVNNRARARIAELNTRKNG